MTDAKRLMGVAAALVILSGPSLARASVVTDASGAPLGGPEESLNSVKIEEPSSATASPDALLSFSGGVFQPQSVVVSNGTYQFDYGSRPSTFDGQLGFGLKLMQAGGAFYFEETINFSVFSANAVQGSASSPLTTSSYTMGLLGVDSRLMYAADWFPWKRLVPFVDGGYRYSFYYQPGASGLESVSGGVGNPVAGGGLRLWLNRAASVAGDHPWFLQARADRIFPADASLNLASTALSGGICLGL